MRALSSKTAGPQGPGRRRTVHPVSSARGPETGWARWPRPPSRGRMKGGRQGGPGLPWSPGPARSPGCRRHGLATPGLRPRGQQAAGWGSACPVVSLRTVGPSKEPGARPPPPTQHLTRRRAGQAGTGCPGGAGRSGWALSAPGLPARPVRPHHAAASPRLLNEPECPPEGTTPDGGDLHTASLHGQCWPSAAGPGGWVPAPNGPTRPRRPARGEGPPSGPPRRGRSAFPGFRGHAGLQDMPAV